MSDDQRENILRLPGASLVPKPALDWKKELAEMRENEVYRLEFTRAYAKVQRAKFLALVAQGFTRAEAHRDELSRYDCGAHLAAHVNPRLSGHAARFNTAMRELERIDPSCPKWTPL